MKKYLKHLVTFGIGLILFLGVLIAKGIFIQRDKLEIFKILSDASFVPAAVIGGIGVIVFVDNNGAFDIIVYGIKLLFISLSRDVSKRKYKTYYDYTVAKHEKSNPYGFLLLVGGFFLLLAIIFLICYLNV